MHLTYSCSLFLRQIEWTRATEHSSTVVDTNTSSEQSLGSRAVTDKRDRMMGSGASGHKTAMNWIRSVEECSGAELVNGAERRGMAIKVWG